MKILDLDMDYFMRTHVISIDESVVERLLEITYGDCIWTEQEVRTFFENNLGLSKEKKIHGRVVIGYNESLFYWRKLIEKGNLSTPFEIIHVDFKVAVTNYFQERGYV
ncbi:MAG: hypothetical protein J1E35_01375 [Lachnospiraceae bacterium]|nr:hypothetical protein [Lachnospiraceae bacterium]